MGGIIKPRSNDYLVVRSRSASLWLIAVKSDRFFVTVNHYGIILCILVNSIIFAIA
ncbi:MAG: hypothetical protein AB4372_15555 [Xenococcus sp. (in: cyanobacteria)]